MFGSAAARTVADVAGIPLGMAAAVVAGDTACLRNTAVVVVGSRTAGTSSAGGSILVAKVAVG